MLADVFTPVGIYLRVRDRFRDTVLLESTDHHAADNSYSFICINAIGGIEISSVKSIEKKYPGLPPEMSAIRDVTVVPDMLWDYMQQFNVHKPVEKEGKFAQGLFGYTTFDAVQFFDTITLPASDSIHPIIPLMRYRLYQYVVVFNHFKDELLICENSIPGLESDVAMVESLIRSKDVPVFPFKTAGAESSNMSDESYTDMVKKGIQRCLRGDVFQIVSEPAFSAKFYGR